MGESLDGLTTTDLLAKRWNTMTTLAIGQETPILTVRPSGLAVRRLSTAVPNLAAPTQGTAWGSDSPGGYAYMWFQTAAYANLNITVEMQQRVMYIGPAVGPTCPITHDGDLWACVDRCLGASTVGAGGLIVAGKSDESQTAEIQTIRDRATAMSVLDMAQETLPALAEKALAAVPEKVFDWALTHGAEALATMLL